jgi:hypothetical protein
MAPLVLMGRTASQTYHAVLANLTVYTPDSQENIISLQRFKGLLKSVECTRDTIDLKFKDDAAREYAQGTWDWVNSSNNHTFVLVADTNDCGWNDHRQPFVVSNLRFDQKDNVAHLTAKASTWQDAVHSYTLQVGTMENPSTKLRRQFGDININRELSLPFGYKLPVAAIEFVTPLFNYKMGVKLDCEDCGTQGSFEIGLHLETTLGIATRVQASLKPHGVGARLVPKLTLSGNITEGPMKLMEKTYPALPIDGITVPGGVLNINPEILYTVNAEVGPLVGSAAISGGTVMTVDDSEHVKIDLLSASPYVQSEWTPKFTARNWVIDNRVTADVRVTGKAKLLINAKTMGKEYDLGLSLIPRASVKIEGVACKFPIVIGGRAYPLTDF